MHDYKRTKLNDKATIAVGSIVRVRDGKRWIQTVRLVHAHQYDLEAGLISIDSPLGEALLGRAVDDKVRVNTPSGVQEFEILHIENGDELDGG